MKVSKGTLALDRFEVPYRIYGVAPETIICISGAKQGMAAWRSFVRYFVADYSIVVFDPPGQGRARTLSGDPGVSFDEQQAVLVGMIEATNRNGPVILAGASWGTIVAAAVASRHPALVKTMILGSFGVSPNPEILSVISEGKELFDQGRTDEIAPLMIRSFGQHVPEAQKRQMVEQFKDMSREEFLSFYAHCVFVESTSHIEDYINLPSIAARTLIVTGKHDALLDHDALEAVSRKIPDCVHKVIPDAGHFLHWEKPEILSTYGDFLSA